MSSLYLGTIAAEYDSPLMDRTCSHVDKLLVPRVVSNGGVVCEGHEGPMFVGENVGHPVFREENLGRTVVREMYAVGAEVTFAEDNADHELHLSLSRAGGGLIAPQSTRHMVCRQPKEVHLNIPWMKS